MARPLRKRTENTEKMGASAGLQEHKKNSSRDITAAAVPYYI